VSTRDAFNRDVPNSRNREIRIVQWDLRVNTDKKKSGKRSFQHAEDDRPHQQRESIRENARKSLKKKWGGERSKGEEKGSFTSKNALGKKSVVKNSILLRSNASEGLEERRRPLRSRGEKIL